EWLEMYPTPSARSNTECTATRPGPHIRSHMARLEYVLHAVGPPGYSKCSDIPTDGSLYSRALGWTQIVSPSRRSRTKTLPGAWSSSSPGADDAPKRSTNRPNG